METLDDCKKMFTSRLNALYPSYRHKELQEGFDEKIEQIRNLAKGYIRPEPGGLKPGEYMHEWLKEDAVELDLPTEEIIGALARDNELLKDKLDKLIQRADVLASQNRGEKI